MNSILTGASDVGIQLVTDKQHLILVEATPLESKIKEPVIWFAVTHINRSNYHSAAAGQEQVALSNDLNRGAKDGAARDGPAYRMLSIGDAQQRRSTAPCFGRQPIRGAVELLFWAGKYSGFEDLGNFHKTTELPGHKLERVNTNWNKHVGGFNTGSRPPRMTTVLI